MVILYQEHIRNKKNRVRVLSVLANTLQNPRNDVSLMASIVEPIYRILVAGRNVVPSHSELPQLFDDRLVRVFKFI